MEQWEQIRYAPDGYFVSDQGQIKIQKANDIVLKWGTLAKTGYLVFSIDGQQYSIHRVVADHFHTKPSNAECVNHINGIKTDNRAINLEWSTYRLNNLHAIETGLRPFKGEDHPNSELTTKQVLEIYRLKKEGKRVYEIQKVFNIDYGTLKCIYSGKNWKYEYQKFFGESYKKQGIAAGSKMWKSIPEEKVLKIYELKKMDKRIFEIAKELDLQFHTVKNIYHGKNWKHLYKEHF